MKKKIKQNKLRERYFQMCAHKYGCCLSLLSFHTYVHTKQDIYICLYVWVCIRVCVYVVTHMCVDRNTKAYRFREEE